MHILGLRQSGGYHRKNYIRWKDGVSIMNLDVDIRECSISFRDRADSRFEADSGIMLEVPASFGGRLAKYEDEKIKTSAGYTPKF